MAGAGCRSQRIAPVLPPSADVDPADVAAFSDLVDELMRIGSHGAIDPKKERAGK